ncbi:hypothetical protein FOCC_FOCC016507, partial [Frankliniella occidentalis]
MFVNLIVFKRPIFMYQHFSFIHLNLVLSTSIHVKLVLALLKFKTLKDKAQKGLQLSIEDKLDKIILALNLKNNFYWIWVTITIKYVN